MSKLTVSNINSRYASVAALNSNFGAIETAIENTLSRDGTSPNSMSANIDMDSNRIVNLPDPISDGEPATKGWIVDQPNSAAASAAGAAASAVAAAASEVAAEAAAVIVVDWDFLGQWTTATAYLVNNIVTIPSSTYQGWSFICIVAHTSGGTFATDYSGGKWEVVAQRGAAGAGTGDMLAASNLSDVASVSSSRTNLGLTALATTAPGTGVATALAIAANSTGGFVTTASAFRKNALINGDFQIWPEGTSFAAIATGTYCAEMWKYQKVGAMVHTVSQSSDVPTIAEAGRKVPYSLLIDCTTVDATIAAGDFASIQTYVEGYNLVYIAGVGLCCQFWHKHTKTGIYCVSFTNGSDRSFVREYTQDVTDTWEFASVLVDATPTAGTWNYVQESGLQVFFTLAAGTDYHGVAATWNSAVDLATANQVNACDDVANNFRLAGVQLEKGSVATEFEAMKIQDVQRLCDRYGQKTRFGWFGTTTSGYSEGTLVTFPVKMRVAPTFGAQTVIGADVSFGGGQATITIITAEAFRYYLTGTVTGANGEYSREVFVTARF
jgi:hypothetical protein